MNQSYKVQSVLIRNVVPLKDAIEWLDKNGFKHSKVDNTENYYRFRQINPMYLKNQGFTKVRTKLITPQIQFIISYKSI